MGTARHTAQTLAQGAAEILEQIEAHQMAVLGHNGPAMFPVGRSFGHPLGIQNLEIPIHRDPQAHMVNRLPGLTQPGGEGVIMVLGIRHPGFQIPQTVFPLVSMQLDTAAVAALARSGGRR